MIGQESDRLHYLLVDRKVLGLLALFELLAVGLGFEQVSELGGKSTSVWAGNGVGETRRLDQGAARRIGFLSQN